jgi:xanthine dehydrogenase molybdopterin binding subunit/xanthine dehydrogenase small subunit
MSDSTAKPLTFVLNGAPAAPDPSVPPTTTLSQWLRATGRTGTKEGCAEGDCGACVVLASDLDAAGAPVWRAVPSCIALLPSFAGREVVTVEGLAPGDVAAAGLAALHPVQRAMVEHAGSQCGYCTPGFVMSMAEGCARADLAASPRAVCAQLDGNLCRCTGYRPIREAMIEVLRARDAAGAGEALVGIGAGRRRAPAPPALERLALEGAGGEGHARFLRPLSLAELLALKATHPEARLLGGATEIGVEVRKKLAPQPFLIATDGVAELRAIEETEEAWTVGGAATLTALDEALAASPARETSVARGIQKMLRVFASRPIRNRATLAGNIATASPIGDMPPVLLALDAVIVCASASGERRVPVADFFVGYRKTALHADEVIRAIVIPKHPRSRFHTAKVSKRKDLDISIVAAAFRLDVDVQGVITGARLAYGGVAATPVRAARAEALLGGRSLHAGREELPLAPSPAAPDELAGFADVLDALAAEFSPIDDVRAGKEYRRGLAASLFERFVLAERAGDAEQAAAASAVDEDPAFVEEGIWSVAPGSRALAHDSALGHVTGGARFVDDVAQGRAMLEMWPVTVPHARAKIVRRDGSRARELPGIRAVLFGEDIPGENDVGAVRHDEALLAVDEVKFHGHPVALVVGESVEQCRRAARLVEIEVEPLPAILGVRAAIEAQSFHTEPHVIARGDAGAAIAKAPERLSGEIEIGGQEHFYLETHAAFAERGEDDEVQVWCSTQHPSEVQAVVSHVLHLPRNRVVVTSPRMGGGFGGKETQGNTWAALAALAAWHTRAPVRVQVDRDLDMQVSGKRHPFLARFDVGFDEHGHIHGFDVRLVSDGGWALDLSESILDRALFHLDNAYLFENVRLEGRVARTHVVSHTAFRGFGGPQGMLVVEEVMGRVASALGLPGHVVRERNFYAPPEAQAKETTPYGQVVDDHRINAMWRDLKESAALLERREEIARFNASSPHVKRGLAITPVKFGISFTASFLNQAGALVLIYRDGTVQVNHGGTEMGQGLHAKVLGIVMRELGVERDQVRVMRTQTDKVPNTSATAASSGADLNGAAVKQACEILRERLAPIAQRLERERGAPAPFADIAEAAYLSQTSLAATGYYRTPYIGYDKKAGRGKPFHYFAYGVCAAEVELDGHTGMKRLSRVDILHDVGDSLNPQIDRGQIEGGFLQGVGWLTSEELKWDAAGRLLTHSASTYQIPTLSDAPAVLRVRLLPDAPQHDVIHGSKAVGEPPLMLALAVREALREAIAAFGGAGLVELSSPLTHEVLFHAIAARRRAAAGGAERRDSAPPAAAGPPRRVVAS